MAAKYLEDKGYEIIERNCRNRRGEIDLICKKGGEYVFVEVKTRIGENFGLPEDAINSNKIRRLIRNAQSYMAFKKESYEIDAVCIVLNENGILSRITHYENIV